MHSHNQTPKVSTPFPLYVVHREHPRPAAKDWCQRFSKHFRLAHPFNGGEPWLPLTTVEGMIVLGHYNQNAPSGEIPEGLSLRVQLSRKDYEKVSPRANEILTAFKNEQPITIPDAWKGFTHDAKIKHADMPTYLYGLQFMIDYGLAPYNDCKKATEYITKHSDCAWLYHHAIGNYRPVLPVDDIIPEMPQAEIPEAIVTKYKTICYAVQQNMYYMIAPHTVTVAQIRTEIRAKLGPVDLVFAYGSPSRLAKMAEATVNKAVAVPQEMSAAEITEDDLNDVGLLHCDRDPHLLKLKISQLEDSRQVLAWIMGKAMEQGATDVHLDPLSPKQSAVRFRINGILHIAATIPTDMLERLVCVIKIRCRKDQTEVAKPQDGKFRIKVGTREAEVRVNTLAQFKQKTVEGAALRIIGRLKIPDIYALGISEFQLQQLKWAFDRDHGIFIVTGPTGSGKTTSLNCFLREIANPKLNVMSIEDPVELPLDWVKQIQVNPDLNFHTALRAFLRHDPDVIMVGEMRDIETAKLGLEAAHTGHQVWATLHTNTALESVPRLNGMGLDPVIWGPSILGFQAQRLVRCQCKDCREEVAIPDSNKKFVERYCRIVRKNLDAGLKLHADRPEINIEDSEATKLIKQLETWAQNGMTYRSSGCSNCHGTGFAKGRAIMEVYLIGNDIQAVDMIVQKRPVYELQRHFSTQGLLDLTGGALRLLSQNETTYDEIKSFLPLI